VDRREERMGAAGCGSNEVLARQELPGWCTHNSWKERPESSKTADDNADLPRLSGRSRYEPATGSAAEASTEATTVLWAVAANGPLANVGL
jgi:hypothetical protein